MRRFVEERHVGDGQPGRVPGSERRVDAWMHDGFEVGSGGRIREDEAAERGAVQTAIGAHEARAEAGDDGLEAVGARCDGLAREQVGGDRRHAKGGKGP